MSRNLINKIIRLIWILGLFSLSVLVLVRIVIVLVAGSKTFSVEDVPARRVAIVFGAEVKKDGTPSAVLRDRVETAVEFYKNGKVEKLLMSGDNRFVDYNEPEAMRQYAVSLGVPNEAIVLDYAGRRTYDTCYRAREIFQVDSAILVTQGFHMPRSLFLCNSFGVESVGVGADNYYYLKRLRLVWYVRETLATTQAVWDVYVHHPVPVLGEPEPIFVDIPEEQATISAFETKVAEYPSICKNTLSYNFSPDGLWRQEFCVSEADREPTLTVSNRETKVLWKMIYRDYLPNSTILDGGMSVSHWSNDGRYSYFNSYMYGDGGGCFVPYSDGGWGLFRLDLQTGNVTTILPVADDLTVFYGFSFSPTDKRLAYRVKQENIVILDMTTEESLKVNHIKDFDDEGGYLWSKDGLRFVYSTGTFTSESEIYSLRLVDVSTGNEQLLLESNGNCYLTTEWKDNNVLIVEQNEPYGKKTALEIDLNSNTIISETPVNP